MKKISILIVLALVLFGCTKSTSALANGNETLVDLNGREVTNQEVYDIFIPTLHQLVYLKLRDQILDENSPIDDELKAEAAKVLEETKEILGEEFNTLLTSYGYANEQEYVDQMIIPQLRSKKLVTKFATDNYDALVEEYVPYQVKLIQFDTEENAKLAHDQIAAGTITFADAAKSYGNSYYNGDNLIISGVSSPSTVVMAAVKESTDKGLLPVINDTAARKFYAVEVVEKDATVIKDAVIESFSTNTSMSQKAYIKIATDNGFQIYDQTVKGYFKESFVGFFAE